MSTWYVVETKPHAERIAAENLARQGFESYLPRYLKRRSHARKVEHVPAPLFPRYLFVTFDENAQWRPISSTIGVLRLICRGDSPLPLPGRVVDEIRAREAEDGLVRIAETPAFRAGDRVRVASGPLEDQVGLFRCADDQKRVILLLDIMGRQVVLRMAADQVEAA